MWRKGIWAAVLLALPISIAAMGSIAYFAAAVASPCVGWGGGSFYKGASAVNHCKQVTVDSRTRTQAALSMAGVQGVILVAAALGIWGTIRSRQTPVIAAGLLMLLETVPTLFSVSPFALLAGVGFLVIAYRMPERAASRP